MNFLIFFLTRISVQGIFKIEELEERDIYYIYNKEDMQNVVYDKHGNSFLILKEFYCTIV